MSRDVAPAGGHLRFTVHLLRAGTYRLVCLKPGHAAKGMKATLRVSPPQLRTDKSSQASDPTFQVGVRVS